MSLFVLVSLPALAGDDGDLKEDLDVIKKNAEDMVEKGLKENGEPASRDFHSRGVCLKGTFTTFPQNLPKDAKVAFFSARATYPMYGRFSNGFPGRKSNDHIPSVFGFGVKLIGVPGQKFDMQSLGSTKPVNANQDWNMATGPTFPIPTAAMYRDNRELSPLEFAAKSPEHRKVGAAILAGLIHIDSFLTMSYHSQVALHFGEDHVAKFFVRPCNDDKDKTISGIEALTRSKHYSTENLIRDIKKAGASFCFYAQIRPADEKLDDNHLDWATKYPKDNPTVLWPTDVITPVKLAEIKFPAQPNVEKLKDTCEALSINPGNTLQDLRPIETDTLMRSRFLAAYEGSVTKRTSLNRGTQSEPSPIPAEMLEKWLAE